jgi:hypothetical protein
MATLDMSYSVFADHPLEHHTFHASDPNAFACDRCYRPRALHLCDGFKPRNVDPHTVCMDPFAHYKGWPKDRRA